GGREALDQVDVGLFHELEELARIGRERLDVAALALGVERVEGKRGLAGARQAGDDDEALARQVEAQVAQVVRARAADADLFQVARSKRETCYYSPFTCPHSTTHYDRHAGPCRNPRSTRQPAGRCIVRMLDIHTVSIS